MSILIQRNSKGQSDEMDDVIRGSYLRSKSDSTGNRNSQKMPHSLRVAFLRKSYEQQQQMPNRLSDMYYKLPLTGTKCPLCEQSFPREQMSSVSQCPHIFCLTCLNAYCVYKINIMTEVGCPQEGCPAVLDNQGEVFHLLPQESKDRYRRNELWKQTMNNPELKLCPTDRCQGLINVASGKWRCSRCGVQFCKECELPEHEGRPCDVNFQDNFRNWKRCPRCKIFIERTEGCNHMTCRCEHQFCYVCLSDWNENHYECGQRPFNNAAHFIENWRRWQQILFAIAMIVLFPLSLCVMLVLYIGGIVLTTIAGFFCGFCLISQQCEYIQNLWPILFPFMMVAGAVAGFFGAIGYGAYLVFSALKQYWGLVCLIFAGIQPQDANGINLVYDGDDF